MAATCNVPEQSTLLTDQGGCQEVAARSRPHGEPGRLGATSGLPPIRLHDLRHCAAALISAADIDIKIASDTLGRSDTRITRAVSRHPGPRDRHAPSNAKAQAT